MLVNKAPFTTLDAKCPAATIRPARAPRGSTGRQGRKHLLASKRQMRLSKIWSHRHSRQEMPRISAGSKRTGAQGHEEQDLRPDGASIPETGGHTRKRHQPVRKEQPLRRKPPDLAPEGTSIKNPFQSVPKSMSASRRIPEMVPCGPNFKSGRPVF